MIKKIVLLLLCSLSLISLKAQNNYGLIQKSIIIDNDSISLDSLSIIEASFSINLDSNIIDKSKYVLIDEKALLIILDSSLVGKQIIIKYRTYPYNFSEAVYNKNIVQIQNVKPGMENPYSYVYKIEESEIFDFGQLDSRGSISRGVSIGNSQDAVVSSGLDLQLNGDLGDGIKVRASITDDNIPLQAEGNTQQLQEFDKVFIELSKNNTSLIAGDFETQQNDDYFMKYNKKAQGAKLSHQMVLDNGADFNIIAAAAVSKGKYNRQELVGVEGNQGPYKLIGAENESYIIVLSGTERVFIDGVLQTRGMDMDYIIDYNTAEITFTTKNIITKDKRIIVEFEYSDQNYARSLFHSGINYNTEKLSLSFDVYSEQDLKNQSLQQDLSIAQKQLLANVGDSLNAAVIPTWDSSAFINTQIMYKRVDTLVSGVIYDSVYVYSTNEDSAFYTLSFSNVGANNGNYIQAETAANGKVFMWVAPVLGVPQGSYEPVVLLISPKKTQMASISAVYKFNESTAASIDFSFSNIDINTFSDKDADDNLGMGMHINVINKKEFGKDTVNKWETISFLDYEYTSANFSPLENYRDVEFTRNWNLNDIVANTNEHLIKANFSLLKQNNFDASYSISSFIKEDYYTGLTNLLSANYNYKGFQLNSNISYLFSDAQGISSNYLKYKIRATQQLGMIELGVENEQESNKLSLIDTLTNSSFKFNQYSGWISNSDSSKFIFKALYTHRDDYLVLNNLLNLASKSNDIGFSSQLKINKNQRIGFNLTYRDLEIVDTLISTQTEDNNLIGRFEYLAKFFKGSITTNTFYEISSGLEAKQDFSYLEVAQGQGVYKWTDYNNNGIQELDEFDIAIYQDEASYIRVYVPTDDYVKVNTSSFSQVLNINPAVLWRKSEGFKRFVSRFSNTTTYHATRKTSSNKAQIAYNPFGLNIEDSSLVSLTSSFQTSIFFNRSDPKFGMDISYKDNRNKSLLSNGYDSRLLSTYAANLRWNISKSFTITQKLEMGDKNFDSEYFNTKDYMLKKFLSKTVLLYQYGVRFRSSISYIYRDKKNTIGYLESAFNNEISIEVKYSSPEKGNFLAKFSYIDINFNADENSSVAYEILQGLKDGMNLVWSLSYQQTILKNLQMNVLYEARKSEGNDVIHVGNVSLRAYF